MNDTVKRDNRKFLPRFLLIVAAAGILGGLAGFFGSMAADYGVLAAARSGLKGLMTTIAPWAIPACTAALLIPGFCLYRKARKGYAAWDQESDEDYQAIEDKLNYCMLLSTLTLLADFLFLAVGSAFRASGMILNALCFLVSIGLILLLQQRVVDLTRRMNPEKKGSIYDVNFQKKWLDSCDELERAQIGQAAFHAYKVLNTVCPILWAVLLLLHYIAGTGLLPILVVIVIWGALQVSYMRACIRLGRRSSR